jgi:hypothetical protein
MKLGFFTGYLGSQKIEYLVDAFCDHFPIKAREWLQLDNGAEQANLFNPNVVRDLGVGEPWRKQSLTINAKKVNSKEAE